MHLSLLEFSQRCLTHIDYNFLVYFDSKEGVDPTLSTYPEEWCTHYKSQNYHKHDFVLQNSSYFPFHWGEYLSKSLSPIQNQIFNEARDFDIYKGITIPIFSENASGALTLTFDKSQTLSQAKTQSLASDLHLYSQMMLTYKTLLKTNPDNNESTIDLLRELSIWQRNRAKQEKKEKSQILDLLSDIRTTQLFIAHHETKELGLETLQRAYQDLEKLL